MQVRSRAGMPVERHLMSFSTEPQGLPTLEELIIYQTDIHEYTDSFKSLTQAFYLNF
jgi:tRNA1(Val) A37 N6-methylase TrmN6